MLAGIAIVSKDSDMKYCYRCNTQTQHLSQETTLVDRLYTTNTSTNDAIHEHNAIDNINGTGNIIHARLHSVADDLATSDL